MSTYEGLTDCEVAGIHKYLVKYEIDEKIVSRGYLIVNDRKKIDDKPVGLIEDIWTHEDYRRQGLATLVMQSLINIAKREGCYKVVLCCANHNIDFYKKLNFVQHQNAMRLNLV